jgi:hypothetical protein
MNRDVYQRKTGLTPEKVARAYQHYRSSRRAAEALGISYRSVQRILKKAGIPLAAPGGSSRKGQAGWHWSAVAKWLRAHPGVRLPRSPQAIAELVGCSQAAVYGYLARRRATAESFRATPDRRAATAPTADGPPPEAGPRPAAP